MKVLLTGMTRRQTSETADSLYFTIFHAYHAALLEAGHEVDWRATEPGEDLVGRYDLAFIGCHSFASLPVQGHKYGAFWAAHELPYLLVFEDWRVAQIAQQMRGEGYFWKCSHLHGGAMKAWNAGAKYSKQIEKVRLRWQSAVPAAILPMMNWADPEELERLIKCHNKMPFDVDPWYPTWPGDDTLPHVREWSCVSLSCQDELLAKHQPSWPVRSIYRPAESVKSGGGVTKGSKPSKWGFRPESELMRTWYSACWGMMLPPYGKGTVRGWWRNRWKIAENRGVVLWTEESDAPTQTDLFSMPLFIYEMMNSETLADIARLQAEFTRSHRMSRADSIVRLNDYLTQPAPPVKEEI